MKKRLGLAHAPTRVAHSRLHQVENSGEYPGLSLRPVAHVVDELRRERGEARPARAAWVQPVSGSAGGRPNSARSSSMSTRSASPADDCFIARKKLSAFAG